jgi:hypothetical protein
MYGQSEAEIQVLQASLELAGKVFLNLFGQICNK